jgi:hypothetical protein
LFGNNLAPGQPRINGLLRSLHLIQDDQGTKAWLRRVRNDPPRSPRNVESSNVFVAILVVEFVGVEFIVFGIQLAHIFILKIALVFLHVAFPSGGVLMLVSIFHCTLLLS